MKPATGRLLDEYECFMGQQPNKAGVTWPAIHLALRNAFWGQDEEALQAIVEMMEQGETESVPDFNRRFETAAEFAYPQALRQPAEDLQLVNLYLKAAQAGPVVNKIFDADPHVVTLANALQMATSVWTRKERQARVRRRTPWMSALFSPWIAPPAERPQYGVSFWTSSRE